MENNINEIEKAIKEQKNLIKATVDKSERKSIKTKIKNGDNVLVQMYRCNRELNKMLKGYNEKYKNLNFGLYFD